jgi:hypothetical protein
MGSVFQLPACEEHREKVLDAAADERLGPGSPPQYKQDVVHFVRPIWQAVAGQTGQLTFRSFRPARASTTTNGVVVAALFNNVFFAGVFAASGFRVPLTETI